MTEGSSGSSRPTVSCSQRPYSPPDRLRNERNRLLHGRRTPTAGRFVGRPFCGTARALHAIRNDAAAVYAALEVIRKSDASLAFETVEHTAGLGGVGLIAFGLE